jgi:uncharacterized protein
MTAETDATALTAPNDTALSLSPAVSMRLLEKAFAFTSTALQHIKDEIVEERAGSRATAADHTISGLTLAHLCDASCAILVRIQRIRPLSELEAFLAEVAATYSFEHNGPLLVEESAQPDDNLHNKMDPVILLGSGNYYDFTNPEESVITIEDIAYGLAFQSRFAGQCVLRRTEERVYYSIAQHCVLLSRMFDDPADAYAALMHEAEEPVCHDMNAPLKSLCPDYRAISKRCQSANLRKFEVKPNFPEGIALGDIRMLLTERRDLTPWKGERWAADGYAEPYDFEITPVDPYTAAKMFIRRYNELRPAHLPEGKLGIGAA